MKKILLVLAVIAFCAGISQATSIKPFAGVSLSTQNVLSGTNYIQEVTLSNGTTAAMSFVVSACGTAGSPTETIYDYFTVPAMTTYTSKLYQTKITDLSVRIYPGFDYQTLTISTYGFVNSANKNFNAPCITGKIVY